jgi:hypothetical protein
MLAAAAFSMGAGAKCKRFGGDWGVPGFEMESLIDNYE